MDCQSGIITEKYSRDNYFCSKLHLSTIKTLIQSDKEHHIDRKSNDHLPSTGIPSTYLMTIAFMRNFTDFLTTSYHPCEKLVKIIIKKESISKYMQHQVEEGMTPLTGGTALLLSVRELIDFERKVERVLSLVLLTLFTYKHLAQSGTDSRVSAYLYFSRLLLEKLTTHEKHFAMIVLSRGILSTGFNFSPVKHALDVQGLYHISNYPDTGLQDIFQSGMSHLGMRSPSNNYKLLFPFASACLRSFCRSDMYPTGGAFENTGSRTDAVIQRELDEAGFKGSVEEWRLCRMFRSLYEFDAESSSDYGLTDQADDLLIYMRRWIAELVSMHFINEDYSNREPLTEEIRTNTVAMELICTSDAFVEGTKSDRKRYNHVTIEIGRYLNVMCTMTDEFTKDITDGSHMNSNTEYSSLTNVKKLMMIISSLKWLSISSKVRKAIGQKFDLKKMHDLYSIVPTLSSARFQDDELFYGSSDSSSSSCNSLTVDLEEKNRRLIEDIDKLLLQSISELLELSPEMLRSPRVLEEVDSIFSTWRRPYLLFDYYKMHCSNKDIRPLYVRFLKALFGISEETFDDIRFKDSKNRRHLDLFDPLLVKQWIEGRATDGTALPGYNDPQTFMMLGEDTHTCMTIRSRQKGTNRGLLSILLNGSCRIVGVKDSAGRLLSRSIVRLLVDELTSRPVLFVDTPHGLHDSSADCSIDVYDQAAELGRLLGVPVVYAKPPPVDEYSMSDFETPAVLYRDDASSDTSSDPPGDSEGHIIALCNLLDKSALSPFMWVNGVYDHHADHYLPFRAPRLIPMWSRNHSVLTGGDSTDLSSMGVVMGVRPAGFIERQLTVHYASSIDHGSVDSLDHGADSVLSDVAITDEGNTVLLNGVQSTALTADLSDSSVSDGDDDDLFFDNVRASSATRRSMVQPSNRISQRDKYRTTTSKVTATVSTAAAASNDIRSATELKTEDSTDILLKEAKFNEKQKAAAAKKRNLRSVQHRQFMRQQTLLTDRNVKRDLKNTPTNANSSSSSSSDEINIESKQPAAVSNDEDDDEFFYPIFDKD